MIINYTWQLSSADGKVNTETGLVNVVKVLNWTCIGKAVGTPACFGYTSWTILDDPAPGSFTPYEMLTEQDLLDWIWAKEDKAAIEQLVANALEGAEELAAVAAGISCLPRFWKDETPYPAPDPNAKPIPAPVDPNAPELPTYLAPDV